MRRKNLKLALRPIDSTKNVVQWNTQIATLSVAAVQLALGVNPGQIDETDVTKITYVEEGSKIFALDFSGMRIFNESGSVDSNSTVMMLRKFTPGTQNTPPTVTLAQMNQLGTVPWKNYLFHIEQAITGSQVSGLPMGFPRIKIPRRYHTMKNNEQWVLYIANNTANNLRACGCVVYKWFK